MKIAPVELLPIFRSDGQARLLAEIFVYAQEPRSLTDLAERTGISLGGVHKEVERLERAGLLVSRRVGRSRLVGPDEGSPFFVDLRSLLTKAFGPGWLIAEALAGITGINRAFIYGSWAASQAGRLARAPRDIDLMVLGSPDLDALYEALREIEETIGRPVNSTVLTEQEWEGERTGFAESVRSGPRVEVWP
jgi:DNA-binding Lrp family transcriptional regulator